MRASAAIERAGFRTLALASTGFLAQAKAIGRALEIDEVPIVEYPGVIPTDSDEAFHDKVHEHVIPSVVAWLEGRDERASASPDDDPRPAVAVTATADDMSDAATDGASDSPDDEPYDPWSPVVRGSLEDIQREFQARQWSDGLPVMPPTPEAVKEALTATGRDPEEVLGVLYPEMREATVHSVAVNAVMAGCDPALVPVAVAAVECIADPGFRLEDGGSTPGWEPLIILSGPRFAALGLCSGQGQMKVGNPATTTLGRFLRLFMRNVAGLRQYPGDTDKGSFGYTFNVAMVEDRDATLRLGWPTFGVDRGFDVDDDVVTVQSVVAISPPIYSGGSTGAQHIETIEHILGATMGPFSFTGVWFDHWHPLLALGPGVAAVFAEDGWSKDDIRSYLYDNLVIEGRWFDLYPERIRGTAALTMRKLVEEGKAPKRYWESDDPHRLLPMLRRPEWTSLVLAGDPGRNQSRAYVNCHEQGAPISRKVAW